MNPSPKLRLSSVSQSAETNSMAPPDAGASQGATRSAVGIPSATMTAIRDASARAVRRALGELKTWAVRNVTTVNDLSGREVLAAGKSLDAIVQQVREQAGETRSALANLASDDDSSVASVIASQAEAITTHTACVHQALARQTQLADSAMQSLRQITSMAQRVSKLAQSIRMLSLNARVEAARLGSGSVFTVIAQEMTSMTNEVRLANTEIEQIVSDLEQALPQIAQQAHDARDQSDTFVGAMREHMARVDGAVGVLRNGVSATLRSSDERFSTVLSVSQDALSHLQFQDTAAQALQRIEQDIAQVTEQLCQHLEAGDLESLEFLKNLEASSSNRARSAGEIVTLDDPAKSAANGGMQGGDLVFL
jgi:sn-glycerol 3-phosphate transport system substrate-binding protein